MSLTVCPFMPGQVHADDYLAQADEFILAGEKFKDAVGQQGAVIRPVGLSPAAAFFEGPHRPVLGRNVFLP